MKRYFSIILVVFCLAAMCAMSAYAEDKNETVLYNDDNFSITIAPGFEGLYNGFNQVELGDYIISWFPDGYDLSEEDFMEQAREIFEEQNSGLFAEEEMKPAAPAEEPAEEQKPVEQVEKPAAQAETVPVQEEKRAPVVVADNEKYRIEFTDIAKNEMWNEYCVEFYVENKTANLLCMSCEEMEVDGVYVDAYLDDYLQSGTRGYMYASIAAEDIDEFGLDIEKSLKADLDVLFYDIEFAEVEEETVPFNFAGTNKSIANSENVVSSHEDNNIKVSLMKYIPMKCVAVDRFSAVVESKTDKDIVFSINKIVGGCSVVEYADSVRVPAHAVRIVTVPCYREALDSFSSGEVAVEYQYIVDGNSAPVVFTLNEYYTAEPAA